MKFKTEQEKFWATEFGDAYISRNKSPELLASNLSFFSKTLENMSRPESVIEFGANIGMNLKAMKALFPNIVLKGIEINKLAADELGTLIGEENVFHGSILDYIANEKHHLVLIKGVLIHMNPDVLPEVYDKLYQSSSKYILVCEYFNPSPMTITYRGHNDRLFKRDFAGEMLDKFPDLELADYGFIYNRDLKFPQDNINWFLLKKQTS